MATIVQPYNPWREQLAASILGPLVGNMIQKGQEAEQNRKRNAMLAAWTDANAVQDPLTGGAISTVPDPLAKQDFTLGFDSDLRPWANSLVDNGALPQMGMSMAAPVQPQAPTLASLFQLGGTKRFGGVNMDTVMPFAKELMAEQEAQRQRTAAAQRQAEMGQFLEGMKNIEGWDPYMRAMSEYVLRGYGGADALKEMSDYALGRQMSPYQAGQLANTQYKNEADFLLGREQNDIDRYKANSQNAHYERSDALGQSELAETITNNEFNRRMKQWELENPEMQITESDMGDHKEVIGVNKRTGEPKLLWTGKVGMSPKDAATAENEAARTKIMQQNADETGRHNRATEATAAATAQNKGAVTEQDRFRAEINRIDNEYKSLNSKEAAVRRGQVDIHGELTEAGKEELKNIEAEREKLREKEAALAERYRTTGRFVSDGSAPGVPQTPVSGDVSVPVSTGSGPVDPAAGKKYAWINRQGEGVTQQQYEKMLAATLTGSPEIKKLGINTVDDLHRVLAERGFYMQ